MFRPAHALDVRGLTKRYGDGTLALESLDLVVLDGAFFKLLGPNGAGKTSLISAVCTWSASPPGSVGWRASTKGPGAAGTARGVAPKG